MPEVKCKRCALSAIEFMRDVSLTADSIKNRRIGQSIEDLDALKQKLEKISKTCNIDTENEQKVIEDSKTDISELEWDVAWGRVIETVRTVRRKLGE